MSTLQRSRVIEQCSKCSGCSGCSGCSSIVLGEQCCGGWMVIRAEPLDGGNVVCIGDDLVDQVARFFTEIVFGGDEETLVFVRRVLDSEEASTNCGNGTDGAATSIEWVLGTALIEMANDQDSSFGTPASSAFLIVESKTEFGN